MLICTKCGMFEGDGRAQFCVVDGGQLIDVSPDSEKWSEGERVIENQTNAFRRTRRILRRRRVLQMSISMMVVTMVICVATINGIIYLKPSSEPEPQRPIVTKPPSTPDDDATTDITNDDPVTDLSKLGDEDPKTKPAKTVQPPCTAADRAEIAKGLLKKYRQHWDGLMSAQPPEVPVVKGPAGLITGKAKLEKTDYQTSSNKSCDSASFIGISSWIVTTPVNGKFETTEKLVRRTFSCHKGPAGWKCP